MPNSVAVYHTEAVQEERRTKGVPDFFVCHALSAFQFGLQYASDFTRAIFVHDNSVG